MRLFILILLIVPFSEFSNKVCFEGNCFNVVIADNNLEREQGLMFIDYLGEDKGMLFLFDKEDYWPFWMKNMLIPLDIIWLDRDGKVVYIIENAQPCISSNCESFLPLNKANYVLEINSGLVEIIGLNEGDYLDLYLNKSKSIYIL